MEEIFVPRVPASGKCEAVVPPPAVAYDNMDGVWCDSDVYEAKNDLRVKTLSLKEIYDIKCEQERDLALDIYYQMKGISKERVDEINKEQEEPGFFSQAYTTFLQLIGKVGEGTSLLLFLNYLVLCFIEPALLLFPAFLLATVLFLCFALSGGGKFDCEEFFTHLHRKKKIEELRKNFDALNDTQKKIVLLAESIGYRP